MKPALANARVEAGAFVIMEGAGRDDELVQQGSGASYRSAVWAFLLLREKRIGHPRTRSHRKTKK